MTNVGQFFRTFQSFFQGKSAQNSRHRKRFKRLFHLEVLEQRKLLAADLNVSREEISPGAFMEWSYVLATSETPGSSSDSSELNGAGLQFNLIPAAGMSQQAINGFREAAALWSAVLSDDILVNINIGFSPLPTNVIGQASSALAYIGYSQVRTALQSDSKSPNDAVAVANLRTGTALSLYTSNPTSGAPILDNDGSTNNTTLAVNTANLKALGLRAANSTGVDATITFSSAFSFDFDRSNGITAGQTDFVGVAAHEIGHALGFSSGAQDVDANTTPAAPASLNNSVYVSTLDLFRHSVDSLAANAGVDVRADNAAKYFTLNRQITASNVTFSNGVNRSDGRQPSHWKDNLGIGAMDPTTAAGDLVAISSNDISAFDAIGWDVKSVQSSGDRLEPNDTPVTATATTLSNSFANLNIGTATDKDVFRFVVPVGNTIDGRIYIDIATPGADLDIGLFDATETMIDSSSGTTAREELSIVRLGPGTYYFGVAGFQGATGAYNLVFALNLNGSNAGYVDTVGVVDPTTYTWYLNNRSDGTLSDLLSFQTPVVPSYFIPVTGDWNGDGTDTVGVYDPYSSTWYLNNSVVGELSGVVTVRTPTVPYWWLPVVGDWNGDGRDSIGLYDSYNSQWYLNNRIDGSTTDLVLVQTPSAPYWWLPIIGDWNGDGRDTIGLYDQYSSQWYLNNRIDGSTVQLVQFQTPAVPNWWLPLTGDWNGDGLDTIGLYDQYGIKYYLNNRTDGSTSDLLQLQVPYSLPPTWKPLDGNWDGLAANITSGLRNRSETSKPSVDATFFGLESLVRDEQLTKTEPSWGIDWSKIIIPRQPPSLANQRNIAKPADVDGNGSVDPLDVLTLINYMNSWDDDWANARISGIAKAKNIPFVDADGDGGISPLDVLFVINQINLQGDEPTSSVEPEGEGEGTIQSVEKWNKAKTQLTNLGSEREPAICQGVPAGHSEFFQKGIFVQQAIQSTFSKLVESPKNAFMSPSKLRLSPKFGEKLTDDFFQEVAKAIDGFPF